MSINKSKWKFHTVNGVKVQRCLLSKEYLYTEVVFFFVKDAIHSNDTRVTLYLTPPTENDVDSLGEASKYLTYFECQK